MIEAFLEYESRPREILKVDNSDFHENLPKALIEGRFCVVIACNQSQFSGCHDDNSNRVATCEHVRVT